MKNYIQSILGRKLQKTNFNFQINSKYKSSIFKLYLKKYNKMVVSDFDFLEFWDYDLFVISLLSFIIFALSGLGRC